MHCDVDQQDLGVAHIWQCLREIDVARITTTV